MPVINSHIVTHHTPENLFALVSDIEKYPEFIHWIKAMRVSGERTEGDAVHKLGEAVVGFKGFNERFATNVTSRLSDLTVHVKLVRGPFRRLENKWSFVIDETGKTRVDFYIDFSFSNPVLRVLARANTDSAVRGIIDAFVAEADKRYGSRQQQTTPPAPPVS